MCQPPFLILLNAFFILNRVRLLLMTILLFAHGCNRPNYSAMSTPIPKITTAVTPLPPAHFEDVDANAGLRYLWQIKEKRPLNILQTIGNGCAFLDCDQDGNLDILFVGKQLALYRGDGHGHFTDVTKQAGLDRLHGHFLGCAVGDYDNDGYPDIYLSGYQTGLLLHNRGSKGKTSATASPHQIPYFEDVTQAAGLKTQPWGTSAAWVETVPGSGRLDLFVANYARFGPQHDIPQLCLFNNIQSSCGPRYYHPLKGVLYRNQGNGHFTDVSKISGIDTTSGRGLGVAFADLDGRGLPALALANDEMPGDLMIPKSTKPPLRYSNAGASSGLAYDRDGNKHGGMGLDWGDYDNDGRLDLLVTTFQSEPKSLYHNDMGNQFSDFSFNSGLGTAMAPNVSFGCKFFDYDNDGWLDLIIASGHVQDNIEQIDTSAHYRQPTRIFHNQGVGGAPQFVEVSTKAGTASQLPIVGRGLAIGDYDNDGRMDALVVDSEGKPLLLHNLTEPTGHWFGIRLIGSKSNRDGYGARLTAQLGGRTLLRHCHADGSYLSSSDPRVHFGLGTATQVDTLTIRWPDGHQDILRNLPADRYVTFREGDSAAHT